MVNGVVVGFTERVCGRAEVLLRRASGCQSRWAFVLAKWEVEFVAAAFGCHCQLVCEHTIYERTILAGLAIFHKLAKGCFRTHNNLWCVHTHVYVVA